MKLILVRHGQTKENKRGIIMGQNPGELSEEGIASSKKLAAALKSKDIDFVVSSDLKRCVDTARILLSGRDIELVTEARLREVNFGEYQGKPYMAITGDYTSDLDKKFPSGESNREFIIRVTGCINDVYAKHENETVLVVGHSGTISIILGAYKGVTFEKAIRELKLHNASEVIIEMSSKLTYLI